MTSISVLIPVHDCQEHICQAVESALSQGVDEVIVFDDLSTDGTLDRLIRYPIQIVRSGERVGQQVANNRLTDYSSGEYLQFLDADDYLLPHKCKLQALAMQDRELAVSFTNYEVLKYNNRLPSNQYTVNTGTWDVLSSLLRFEWPVLTGGFMFHRSVFDRVRWDESPRYYHGMHDRKMMLDLLKAGLTPVHLSDCPGYVHRCGWSGSQLGAGQHYLQARRNFTADLYQWVEELERQTWRRIELESALPRC